MHKLLGTQSVGSTMPAYMPPLIQADIDLVADWIADCARIDAVAGEPAQ
jgi:hypothetical protein